MLRPHPEERPLGRVSKDGRVHPRCHPSRRAQERAPQDEVSLVCNGKESQSSDLPDTDKDTQRETILLTDAELDAVVGGAVALHDFAIVKHVDKASPKLSELC
jgi:hypothetical protein